MKCDPGAIIRNGGLDKKTRESTCDIFNFRNRSLPNNSKLELVLFEFWIKCATHFPYCA